MTVRVFVFRADDGRTRAERLRAAACLTEDGVFPKEEGAAEELWRIDRKERGKPYFPNQPGLHFSISHSGALWVCAFSGHPVGVDIQKHTKKRKESDEEAGVRLARMAERFFHPDEAAWVREHPCQRFFQIWAAKESYVKYTGDGIGAGFGRFCLVPSDEEAQTWKAEEVWFYGTELPGGYSLCVCGGKTKMSVQIADFCKKTDKR